MQSICQDRIPLHSSPLPSRTSSHEQQAQHPGTPRPDVAAPPPLQRQGTPRPEGPGTHRPEGPGTPRPDAGAPAPPTLQRQGTPRPDSSLRFVEDSTLRTPDDFSRDTPQPKLVRRLYQTRSKAKEHAGVFTPDSPGGASDASPSSGTSASPASASKLRSPLKSPSCSPSSRAKSKSATSAAQVVGFHQRGAADVSAVGAEEDEDAGMASLRSSVRSLCF